MHYEEITYMNPQLTIDPKEKASDVKVMIVDDDHFILNMYKIKFEHAGFDIKTASNGQEALDIARSGYVPHVLLIDIIMPVMGGIEFLNHIREEKLFEHVPIIVLSNQSQSSDISDAMKLGVKSYIVKATTIPSEIVDEIKNMFGIAADTPSEPVLDLHAEKEESDK
jgi:CheY-like chemotaxis protein